jgi:hypothetical protein
VWHFETSQVFVSIGQFGSGFNFETISNCSKTSYSQFISFCESQAQHLPDVSAGTGLTDLVLET